MHDGGEPESACDPCHSGPASLGDLEGPAFQRKSLPRARQDEGGTFVEELTDGAVALLGDAPREVELARLMSARDEPEVGACSSLWLEPARVVGRRGERSGSDAALSISPSSRRPVGCTDE